MEPLWVTKTLQSFGNYQYLEVASQEPGEKASQILYYSTLAKLNHFLIFSPNFDPQICFFFFFLPYMCYHTSKLITNMTSLGAIPWLVQLHEF